jgi:amidase
MARTVYDTALLLEAVAGYDQIDDRQLGAPFPGNVPSYTRDLIAAREQGINGLRVGVLKEGFYDKSMAPEVERVVRNAIDKFVKLGASVEDVSVPT